MTENDWANFRLVAVADTGDETLLEAMAGPREQALQSIVREWRKAQRLGTCRVYEIVRVPVDLSSLEQPEPSPLILPPGVQ